MDALVRDFKQGLRALRRSPVFAAAAVLSFTLGIGANIAIFSVFNAVVLEPVPFPEPETLVQLVHAVNGQPSDSSASAAEYMYLRQQTDVLEDVAAYGGVSVDYTGGEMPEPLAASQVTAPYFRTFRVPMALGRPFTTDEDAPGAPKTTVISYGFWVRELGGDPAIVGRTLSLNGVSYTVVGVTAPQFDTREFGHIDLWVPLQLDANTTNDMQFKAAARLKPGVSLRQAQARLEASTAAFRERVLTAYYKNVRFSAVSFKDAVTGASFRNDPRRLLWPLFGAVAFVLLIACANVASLMVVRAGSREREMAVRSALGAGRWRITKQLATEGAILSAVGATLGLIFGFVGIRALLAVNTAGLPRLGKAGTLVGMDWRVIAFAVTLSIVTVILSGVLPALVTSRTDPNAVLRYSSSPSATGFRKNRGRSILIVAEVSLALILLIGATLLIRTTVALNSVNPGFNVHDVVVMHTLLSERRFQTATALRQNSRNALGRVRAIPNVEAAAASCCVPLQNSWGEVFKIIGRDDGGRPFSGGGDVTISTAGYFKVFQIPVLRGRVFNQRDDSSAPPVIVINRALAERLWPNGQDPIGQKIRIGGGHNEPSREVIGVVDNVRKARLQIVRPIMYVPIAQISDAWLGSNLRTDSLAWIVRTKTDPMRLSRVISEQIRQTLGVPVTDIQSMKQVVSASISRQRASMLLMTIFGGVALLLAAVGIYGLVAFSVQQRTHEIGIRVALGAQRDRILAMVIRQGTLLVAIGTTIGVAGAYFLTGLLRSVLYGVGPRDPIAFVGGPLLLGLVTMVAVSIPACRASRASPLDALRYD